MGVKATLEIKLYANDVLIAESDDEALWQSVLSHIHNGGQNGSATSNLNSTAFKNLLDNPSGTNDTPIALLASEIGVAEAELVGACSPSEEAPFIHLEVKNWEAFKKNTPPRGSNSVPAITLAATILCLWFKHRGNKENPTPAQVKRVLATINVVEKNPTRSINNCEWLQSRNGTIQINPAKYSKALAIATAFCAQKPIAGDNS